MTTIDCGYWGLVVGCAGTRARKGVEPAPLPMAIAVLWRAVLLRIFRMPAIWLLAAALLGLVPVLARFSPLLAGTGEDLGARRVAEWAFPVALTATLLGQWALLEMQGLTLRLPTRSRIAAHLGGFLALIWALQLPLSMGALATDPARAPFSLAGRMILVDLHLAALATLLAAVPCGGAARGALFLGIAWLLPAFLAEGGTVMRLVASWVDAGRFLRQPEFDFHSPAAWAALGPPIGLFGASLLFRPARI